MIMIIMMIIGWIKLIIIIVKKKFIYIKTKSQNGTANGIFTIIPYK